MSLMQKTMYRFFPLMVNASKDLKLYLRTLVYLQIFLLAALWARLGCLSCRLCDLSP